MRLGGNFLRTRFTEITILLVLSFIRFGSAVAQEDTVKVNYHWHSGILILKDQTKLEGVINHNEKIRSIKFKAKLQDAEELSFDEMAISSMKYYDTNLSKSRQFYTWEVENDGATIQGPALYEVILVTKNFVVLSRKFAVLPASGMRDRNDANISKIEYDKVEKIFLAGKDTKAELLWLDALKGEESKAKTSQIQPFFSADVLKKYTESYWRDVKSFVKKRRLKLKRKSDLMKALTYFQQLENVK